MHRRKRCVVWIALIVFCLGAGSRAAGAQAQDGAQADIVWPAWLEARGLSLIDLVGQVPEQALHGAILVYGDNSGIVVYESGTRTGNRVVVTATIYPRIFEASWAPNGQYTQFSCLGQKPIFDHLGAAVPASVLRVYTMAGVEVTSEIEYMYIEHLGIEQPQAGSSDWQRYPVDSYGSWKPNPLPLEPDGLHIPANGGCEIHIPGLDYYPLTGVFTFENAPALPASIAGSQTATFRSYIGRGETGIFAPLMDQLRSRYADRHGRITLAIPAGASHFLVKFPPMPADPFADQKQSGYRNASRLIGGTYRLSGSGYLSANLTFSGVFPLAVTWRDADQSAGAQFLPLMWSPGQLAPPEHIIPEGVAYNACFTRGNCSDAVLEQIYNAVMSLEIIYLSVDQAPNGEWVSLKQAGPTWAAGETAQAAGGEPSPAESASGGSQAYGHIYYVPLVSFTALESPPGNCPCGWFDAQGQLLDYYAVP